MTRCFLVSGRVQGVFFRAATCARAQQLGLVGHARNLPDGRVEVLAMGMPAAVEALAGWLWQGPPAAQVTQVHEVAAPESSGAAPVRFARL